MKPALNPRKKAKRNEAPARLHRHAARTAGCVARFSRSLGAEDRARLDQYLTSVRELEQRLEQARVWQQREKPRVTVPQPQDILDNTQDVDRARLMYDMTLLALQPHPKSANTACASGTKAPRTATGPMW